MVSKRIFRGCFSRFNSVEIIFDYWSNVLLLFKHTGHTEWVVIELQATLRIFHRLTSNVLMPRWNFS